ncbi:MAG: PspC domain-containing protein [candidate division Zixibacteria bacterium]|nr:PspC domain-containing protein [candidate division Zixibacteria bacterium]
MKKRLYRSTTDKMIAGICGGLADYFDTDPALVRILMVVLFFSGVGFPAYIVGWIVIPKSYNLALPTDSQASASPLDSVPPIRSRPAFWSSYYPGVIFILVGAAMLMREFWRWFDFGDVWPVILILAGAAVIFFGRASSKGMVQSTQEQNGGTV